LYIFIKFLLRFTILFLTKVQSTFYTKFNCIAIILIYFSVI
jgi:hypothetical protein